MPETLRLLFLVTMPAVSRLALLLVVLCFTGFAQRNVGEMRLSVVDSTGAPVTASVHLANLAAGIDRTVQTTDNGRFTFTILPFGLYQIEVSRAGFRTETRALDIHGETPINVTVSLNIASVETSVVVVGASGTLLNPYESGSLQHVSQEFMHDRTASLPGRSVLELVNSQPGWLLEANGVLHPRGSEYQVQYVVDGMPMLDNRSPAFAQSLGVEEFESMDVRTGGYPAEYGRKLGGVIEISTNHDKVPGLHGSAVVQGGSFATTTGFASADYSGTRFSVGASVEGLLTERYLDPPVQENYTNHASGGGVSARGDYQFSDRDRTRVYVSSRRTGFLVPNELLQERAGQRQDRTAGETAGSISHQHVFSPQVLGNVRLMSRDTNANLWSNALSTPIAPFQDRGFREAWASASVAWSAGRHEVKAGTDAIFGTVHEDFAYRIAAYRLNPGNVRIFDSDIPRQFAFSDHRQVREQSAFVQDSWRLGNVTLNGGVRFDHYRLVSDASAWSPRVSVSWHLPRAGIVFHAAYDRTFDTPAVENILLASTNPLGQLGGEGAFLPLNPARGHFVEAGFSKAIAGRIRVGGTWYRRYFHDFPDDSLLLNTGVSFPIAFSKAEIQGFEAKVEFPKWGPFSGFASYSNMTGRGYTPVSGGLFLGDDADLLTTHDSFPITQDQRNTARARVRWAPHNRFWIALQQRYNSGLPVELEGVTNMNFITAQYGPAILERVNFSRERVRPSASTDATAAVVLYGSEHRSVRLVADVLNLTNRLNLINFAGVFSGTAIEPPRTWSLRLQTTF